MIWLWLSLTKIIICITVTFFVILFNFLIRIIELDRKLTKSINIDHFQLKHPLAASLISGSAGLSFSLPPSKMSRLAAELSRVNASVRVGSYKFLR
jgi:galactitol-specific phosphotransferase system IIC component